MTISLQKPSLNWPVSESLQTKHIRKYPPFGKQLSELRRRGLIPAQRIIVSTDWKLGAVYPRIVIPADYQTNQLIFDYLAGLSVQIVHHDAETNLAAILAVEIMKVRPKTLVVFNFDHAKRGSQESSAFRLIHPSLEVIKNEF